MLDCGGGTTDVGTYTIAHEFPLRLGQEVGHPNGKLPYHTISTILSRTGAICGSGDLNDRMRTLAAVHLNRDAPDLGKLEGATIASIIESEIMPNFERNIKRHFKISDAPTERYVFVVRGLREHPQNPRIKTNRFMLT